MRTTLWFLPFLLAASAFPCSIIVTPHSIDPAEQAVDRTPPSHVVAELKNVRRGRGPVAGGNGTTAVSSCDDLGSITVQLSSSDDRTAADSIGYLPVHVEGDLPAGLLERAEAQRSHDGTLTLWWIDGATDAQEPLEFALAIVAVDRAGNRSEPSAPVWIRHPGSPADPDSCH